MADLATSPSLGPPALTVDGGGAIRNTILGSLLDHQWPLQLLGNLLQLILPVSQVVQIRNKWQARDDTSSFSLSSFPFLRGCQLT